MILMINLILMDENTKQIMEDHDIDKDTAEHIQEIMDEYGVDEDDAIMLEEEL